MPVFNGEKTLEIAINSILIQTFSNFELIISNNASSDSTAKICKYYSSIDPRIRYFEQTQFIDGLRNFEYVLKKAKASYFMWAACDDLWELNWIEELLPISQKYFCLATGNCIAINHDGTQTQHIANDYQFSFTANRDKNRKHYFLIPSFLGKANAIYGIGPIQIFSETIWNVAKSHGDMLFLYSVLSKFQIHLNSKTTRYVRLKTNFVPNVAPENDERQQTLRYRLTYFLNVLRTALKSVHFWTYWQHSSNSERMMLIYNYPIAIVRALIAIRKFRFSKVR